MNELGIPKAEYYHHWFGMFIDDVQPGLKNGAVLTYATQQQALLVTADKTDFGRLFQQQQFYLTGNKRSINQCN